MCVCVRVVGCAKVDACVCVCVNAEEREEKKRGILHSWGLPLAFPLSLPSLRPHLSRAACARGREVERSRLSPAPILIFPPDKETKIGI